MPALAFRLRMTLSRLFSKLRHNAGMSLREVGKRARPRIDATTILKIEKGRPVRAQTLASALRALGLQEKDEAYVEAFALWSMEQAGTLTLESVDRGIARAKSANNRAFQRVVDRVVVALRKMPETDWPAILEALDHPEALKLWLQSRK